MLRGVNGLCDGCVHQKRIVSGKGSTFSMCLRSRWDARYPKYPRLPVTDCEGYEPATRTEPADPFDATRTTPSPSGR